MTEVAVPPVPVWLAHLPTVGGLVVPWITPRAGDGRYLFGVLDPARQHAALTRRLCQVCGRPLGRRLVLLMRAQDLPRRCTAEPGCDPACCAHVQAACPMVVSRQFRISEGAYGWNSRMVVNMDECTGREFQEPGHGRAPKVCRSQSGFALTTPGFTERLGLD
jgi:hypothetical protein